MPVCCQTAMRTAGQAHDVFCSRFGGEVEAAQRAAMVTHETMVSQIAAAVEACAKIAENYLGGTPEGCDIARLIRNGGKER